MEMSYHMLYDTENDKAKVVDKVKKKIIADTCNGISENTKILHLRTKAVEPEQAFADNLKVLYTSNSINSAKKQSLRSIPKEPEKILDAPEFKDDYCKYFDEIILTLI